MKTCKIHRQEVIPFVVNYDDSREHDDDKDECPVCFDQRVARQVDACLARLWAIMDPDGDGYDPCVSAAAGFELVDQFMSAWGLDGGMATDAAYEADRKIMDALRAHRALRVPDEAPRFDLSDEMVGK